MRIIFLLLTLITSVCASDPQSDPLLHILPRFEDLIHQSMNQKKIPGMAVAIVSKGQVIFMKGFGVRALGTNAPVNTKTLFQLGSVSKVITATLVAILKRDQHLNIDQFTKVLPDVTLKHILSHTTGIPSAGFNNRIERGDSPLEIQEMLKNVERQDVPGEKFAYHNAVYNLTKIIIEQEIGHPFEVVLQEKLFGPFQMRQTFSTWQGFLSQENRISPHVFSKAKGKKKKAAIKTITRVSPRKEYMDFPAAAGMSSTIEDMALFLNVVMGARPEVISSDDLKDFMQPVVHTPDQWRRTSKHRDRITETYYGLGWRYMTFANNPLIFHGGWIRGISTIVAFLPNQQVGIVILQNAESGLPAQLTMQFFDWVLGLHSKKWIK